MEELLLCNSPAAAVPYYVEGISLNIYSLEELSYYIANNVYLLDDSFMNGGLCTWIEEEMKAEELGHTLREILEKKGRLSSFAGEILMYCGYYEKKEILEILQVIAEMEEKSDFECNKIRADRLLEKGKYYSSIYEYKRILESREIAGQNAVLEGNVWHNLGTAYARLFLFESAAKCYEKAYALNEDQSSLNALLKSYYCLKDENNLMQATRDYHVEEMELQEIKNQLSLIQDSEKMKQFEAYLDAFAEQKEKGMKAEEQRALMEIIRKWKEDYRSISKG